MRSFELMGLVVWLILFYALSAYKHLKALVFRRKCIALLLIISMAIGVNYLCSDLLAPLSVHSSTQGDWSNIVAVFVFIVGEGIGVWQLIRNQDQYKIWVMPALIDLFLKGLIAFAVFGNITWLIWDSCRAVFLLILINYDHCQKR